MTLSPKPCAQGSSPCTPATTNCPWIWHICRVRGLFIFEYSSEKGRPLYPNISATFSQIHKWTKQIKPVRKLKRKPPVQYKLEQAA